MHRARAARGSLEGITMRITVLAAILAIAPAAFAQNNYTAGTALSGNGRFVLGQISAYRKDQFVIDTQTGRVWRLVCLRGNPAADECGRTAFQPTTYLDFADKEIGWTPPIMVGKP